MRSRNPEFETAMPYNLNSIHPDIRPRDSKYPVEAVPLARADLPRQTSVWQARDDEGRPVFWCWSCDRRVRSVNHPFCLRLHRQPRRNFVRRRKAAWKKPLPVSWDLIEELNDHADLLMRAAEGLDRAESASEATRARTELLQTSARMAHFIRTYLSRRPASPVGMPPTVAERRQRRRG